MRISRPLNHSRQTSIILYFAIVISEAHQNVKKGGGAGSKRTHPLGADNLCCVYGPYQCSGFIRWISSFPIRKIEVQEGVSEIGLVDLGSLQTSNERILIAIYSQYYVGKKSIFRINRQIWGRC